MSRLALFVALFCCCTVSVSRAQSPSITGPGTVHVEENTPAGTLVATYAISDGGTVSWAVSGVSSSDFTMDSSSGQLTIANPPDRETKATYMLAITATGSVTSTKMVTVVILDVNDNSPTFENAPTTNITITLSESEPVDSVVYTVFASDPDEGSSGNFHFVLTDPDNLFIIGYLTGNIELHQSLDHESNTQHTLTVLIVDEGAPSLTTTVTINVAVTNSVDQAPVFTKKLYFATTPEGVYSVMSPALLTTIHADDAEQDPTAVIKYSIVDNGQPWISQFTVNEDTGVVQASGTLDFEVQSRYVVPVQAREYAPGGLVPTDAPPSSATVVAALTDINDNPPVFLLDHYSGVVPEDASIGHIVIASVDAFDRDQGSNGDFTYKIRDRATSVGDKFNINNNTGVIFVTGSLDHETNTDYAFTIEAIDQGDSPLTGTAAVSIQVQDVNDHPPVFVMTNYTFSILENSPATTFTQAMEATDVDNDAVMYTLAGQGSGTSFQLSVTDNQAFLATTGPLDRETVSNYHMLLLASDGIGNSLTATANVFVTVGDRNDNSPQFNVDSLSVDIVEETSYLSSCFSVQASDEQDFPGPNTDITYSFTVSASSPNTNTVNAATFFSVDSGTGQFSCAPINHEDNYHSITIIAIATDKGTDPGPQSSSSTIQITVEDINEHPPIFSSPTYSATILESHAINTGIGLTVSATESGDVGLNHNITYAITSGNIGGAFAVNEATGVITLANSVDYETLTPGNNPIVFTVRAVDQVDSMGTVQSSSATVMVTIGDINDNTPTFPGGSVSLTVSEGDPPGVLYTFQAVDNDGPSDGVLQYTFSTPPYGMFTIGVTSGVLTMTTAPDREALPAGTDTFTFTVTATDNPSDPALARSGTVSVMITVTDINDNPPIFSQPVYSPPPLPEDSSTGYSIVSLPVTDADSGTNSQIAYSIQSISPIVVGDVFVVDQAGVLRVGTGGFDYDGSVKAYTVTVIAQDMGLVSLSATAVVMITLSDVNDHVPTFENPLYTITIDETNGLMSIPTTDRVIGSVSATDSDAPSSPDSTITFMIEDSRARGWFGVNPSNGEVHIIGGQEVDREATHVLIDSAGRGVVTFDILAIDGGSPSLTGTAEITINIEDVNDSPPVFSQDTINTGIPESATPGSLVEVISATDADYGSNAALTYQKTAGDTENLFNISDPSSGRVVVSGFLDKEAGTPGMPHIITFTITASDQAGNTDTVQVMVEITDSNDNSPVFSPAFYTTSIFENTTFDQAVEFVFASDADTGSNGDITYAIVGGNINNAFYLKNATTQGNIRVNNTSAIDRETTPFYRLIITATDSAFPASYRRAAVAECVVVINDINDNSPKFLYPVYSGSVPEGSPVGSTVIVSPALLAMDADIGTNAAISYDIPPGDEFQIDPMTGVITTSMSTLDREERDTYTITLQARDGGGRVGTAQLTISVTDINDKAPVFLAVINNTDLDQTLPEDLSVGGHVVDAIATDDDIGVNAQLTYSVTGGSGYFQIDSSGTITLAQTMLPTERLGPFELMVSVVDGGIPAMSASIEVDITVTDVNDNAPMITRFPQMAHVSEDHSVGTTIMDPMLPIQASDIDEGLNAEIEFLLNAPSSFFEVENSTGAIYLTAPLDRETLAQHTISVVARDKGSPSRTSSPETITIIVDDVNDNSPVFSQNLYSVNVSENTGPGVPLLLLAAADNDTGTNAVINFEIMGPTLTSLFRIDAETGLVLTDMTVDESHSDQCYNLTVLAKDGGVPQNTDTATVMICIIDFNDGPQFNQAFYNFSLPENLPAGTVVGTVAASDPDPVMNPNSVISFSVVTSPGDVGLFNINSTTGVITLLKPLDREEQSTHVLTVIAQNQGLQHANYTTVQVNVEDLNDNDPMFEFNTFSVSYTISEDISRNTTIAKIGATDADLFPHNLILFDILSDPRVLFKIDHETGLLQTEAGHGPDGFDYEQFTQYSIVVIVYNGADARFRNSTVTITFNLVDVNDVRPVFVAPPSSVTVSESAPGGFVITTIVANDSDTGLNGQVLFGLANDGKNIGDAFSIGALTGNLMVLNPLDYESPNRNYTLNITIHDLGIPMLFNYHIITISVLDANDNPPMFIAPDISLTFPENSLPGTEIYKFVVTDRDDPPFNQSVISIAGGNEEEIFYINSSTNTLHFNSTDQLDFESGNTTFTIIVQATDTQPGVGGVTLSATATVSLSISDVNDNPPVFDEAVYNISLLETTAQGTIVERVLATDLDIGTNSALEYSFIDGNTDETFSINSADGTIILAKTLDHDSGVTNYTLTIIVENMGLNDTALLYVTVIDVNDHTPVFVIPPQQSTTLEIYENTTIGSEVFKVLAVDGDGDVVTYSLSNDLQNDFSINPATGVIVLTKTLDRETQRTVSFTVLAKDSGNLTSSAAFTVVVRDNNDHTPYFPQNLLIKSVSEDAPVGIDNPLVTLIANDSDDGDSLFYHLVVNNHALVGLCDGMVCIGRTSGRLYFNRTLDRETQDSYSITVVVSNTLNLSPIVSVTEQELNTLNILVQVTDINDNNPQFQEFTTRAGVRDSASFGSSVTTVVATDRDIGRHAIVWYDLTATGSPFVIQRETGLITTSSTFLELVGNRYTLNVEAFDNEGFSPSLRNETSVNVWVYHYYQHIIIFTVNRTLDVVGNDLERYIRGLESIFGGDIVIITDVTVETSDLGSITKSGSDMPFLVVGGDGQLKLNRETILRVENSSSAINILFGNENPRFRIPREPVRDIYPLWLWVVIAVLVALILLLCCAFCVFLIVEKRVNRKLRQEVLESSYSALSQSLTTNTNPMWVPPPPDDDISLSSLGTKQTVEKPNPVYEEQEVVMELFMDDDESPPPIAEPAKKDYEDQEVVMEMFTESVVPPEPLPIIKSTSGSEEQEVIMELFTDEDNEDPPMGSTDNLLAPGYRDSVTTHDLLAEAVGLPLDENDSDGEDYMTEI